MSKIEWTNETWNPIIGCSKISVGCSRCYAQKMATRLANIKSTDYYQNVIHKARWNSKTYFVETALNKPLKWKKARMIFVCSMSDLFHESIPFEWIDKVFDIIEKKPQHTYQLLTKRPKIMYEYMKRYGVGAMPENIWLGVTAENQDQANKRIPILLQISAKIRFVSVEPMLSEVEINIQENALDWVICGGESGLKARSINPSWVRKLRDQCKRFNVPFFFKQWHKKSDGCLIDGKEYKQFPGVNLK